MDSLDELLDHAWLQLGRGVPDMAHGFHWPVVATVDDDGLPEARVVVLRSALRDAARFTFHTDARSPKVRQLTDRGRAALLFHDGRTKLQVRARCRAAVLEDGDLHEAGWNAIGLGSKRCYLAPNPPSTPAEAHDPNVPEEWRNRVPTEAAVAAGRSRFRVIACTAVQLDVLLLLRDGHRRAQYDYDSDGSLRAATWLRP